MTTIQLLILIILKSIFIVLLWGLIELNSLRKQSKKGSKKFLEKYYFELKY